MSLDKAIEHNKEKRKPYRKHCEAVDPSCRCHGGCPWCLGDRMYRDKRLEERDKQELKNWEMGNDESYKQQ